MNFVSKTRKKNVCWVGKVTVNWTVKSVEVGEKKTGTCTEFQLGMPWKFTILWTHFQWFWNMHPISFAFSMRSECARLLYAFYSCHWIDLVFRICIAIIKIIIMVIGILGHFGYSIWAANFQVLLLLVTIIEFDPLIHSRSGWIWLFWYA